MILGKLSMVKPVVEGHVDDILQEIMQVDYGQHNLLIYSDLIALNEIYSRYFSHGILRRRRRETRHAI